MKRYKTSQELENALCEDICTIIHASIRQYGDARILLSGGSTPKSLYNKLAQVDLNWPNVKIGLVDDRCVPLDSEFSNESMLRDIFSSNGQVHPTIYSLVHPPEGVAIEEHYAAFLNASTLSFWAWEMTVTRRPFFQTIQPQSMI